MNAASPFQNSAWCRIFEPRCFVALFLLAFLGQSTAVSGQELSVEQVWEVGSIAGPEETIWSRISDAAIFAGHVYVADIELATVRRFTIDGRFRGEVGRRGQGPGEFVRPSSLTVSGDTLRVYDVMQNRWSLIGEDGAHIRTSRPVPKGKFFRRLWPARAGWLIGETSLVSTSSPSQSITSHFIIAWDSTSLPDTVASIPGNPIWTKRIGLDSLVMVTTNTLGADGGAWLLGDSVLVVVNGATSRAVIFEVRPSGLVRVREQVLPGLRRRLSDHDREAVADWYYWRVGMDPSKSTIQEFFLPEWWSAWTRVRGDDRGGIWIRRGGPSRIHPEAGEVWVRWSPEHEEFHELELPAGVEALQFGEGYVVALRRDSLSVQYLVLFRICGLDGPGCS